MPPSDDKPINRQTTVTLGIGVVVFGAVTAWLVRDAVWKTNVERDVAEIKSGMVLVWSEVVALRRQTEETAPPASAPNGPGGRRASTWGAPPAEARGLDASLGAD